MEHDVDIIIVGPASCDNIRCLNVRGRPLRSYHPIKCWGETTLQPSLNMSLVTARMILQLDRCLTRSQSLDR